MFTSRIFVARLAIVIAMSTSGVSHAQRKPERITLPTKDGFELICQYYPGVGGESCVPIILLHNLGQRGSELTPLATFLNGPTAGRHAVIVPDYRGHGESSVQLNEAGVPLPTKLKPRRFQKADFQDVVMQDLEAVKRFLIKKHNERKLNIDMLSVVGTDFGALVGLYWTVGDWSWPVLSGGRKQGQDVKALVLITPPMGFKGISANRALGEQAIRDNVAIQILYGKKGKGATAARRYNASLARHREGRENYDYRGFETTLQGSALLTEKQLNVAGFIASFIKKNVADRKDSLTWRPRATADEDSEQEPEQAATNSRK